MEIKAALRDTLCDAFVDNIDSGGTGTIQIRTGSSPGVDSAATGTLLATLTFSATAFGASSSGTATAAAITSDTDIDATGTAGYARIINGGGTAVADLTVGTSGQDLNFDSVSFVATGTAAISSLTVTMPAS